LFSQDSKHKNRKGEISGAAAAARRHPADSTLVIASIIGGSREPGYRSCIVP
jgi:hypothetical protein